jgi:hypothetical protein
MTDFTNMKVRKLCAELVRIGMKDERPVPEGVLAEAEAIVAELERRIPARPVGEVGEALKRWNSAATGENRYRLYMPERFFGEDLYTPWTEADEREFSRRVRIDMHTLAAAFADQFKETP